MNKIVRTKSKAGADTASATQVTSIKGFNSDLTCRGFPQLREAANRQEIRWRQ